MTNLPDDLLDSIAREIAFGREARQPDRVTAQRVIDLINRQATPADSPTSR